MLSVSRVTHRLTDRDLPPGFWTLLSRGALQEALRRLELIPVFFRQSGQAEVYLGSTVATRERHVFHFTSKGFCSHGSEFWSLEMIDSEIARQTMRRTQTSTVHGLVGSQIHFCTRALLLGYCFHCYFI